VRRRWEVSVAAGSEEAIDILREHDIDVLLCDLVLTDEDALDVLGAIQRYRPDLLAHTVLMSGEPTTGRLIDLARNNRSHLIRKPFAPLDLQELLDAALVGHPKPVTLTVEYDDIADQFPSPKPTTWGPRR
jgi:DNA-binding NtrC family response regulator